MALHWSLRVFFCNYITLFSISICQLYRLLGFSMMYPHTHTAYTDVLDVTNVSAQDSAYPSRCMDGSEYYRFLLNAKGASGERYNLLKLQSPRLRTEGYG